MMQRRRSATDLTVDTGGGGHAPSAGACLPGLGMDYNDPQVILKQSKSQWVETTPDAKPLSDEASDLAWQQHLADRCSSISRPGSEYIPDPPSLRALYSIVGWAAVSGYLFGFDMVSASLHKHAPPCHFSSSCRPFAVPPLPSRGSRAVLYWRWGRPLTPEMA